MSDTVGLFRSLLKRDIEKAVTDMSARSRLCDQLRKHEHLDFDDFAPLLQTIAAEPGATEDDRDTNYNLLDAIMQHRVYSFVPVRSSWTFEQVCIVTKAWLGVRSITAGVASSAVRLLVYRPFRITDTTGLTGVQMLYEQTDAKIVCHQPPAIGISQSSAVVQWLPLLCALAENGRLCVDRSSFDPGNKSYVWLASQSELDDQPLVDQDAAALFVLALLSGRDMRAKRAQLAFTLVRYPRLHRIACEFFVRLFEFRERTRAQIGQAQSAAQVINDQQCEWALMLSGFNPVPCMRTPDWTSALSRAFDDIEQCRQVAVANSAVTSISIKNMRAYLLTALFEITVTLQQIYTISTGSACQLPSLVLLTIFRYAEMPCVAFDRLEGKQKNQVALVCRVMERATRACAAIYADMRQSNHVLHESADEHRDKRARRLDDNNTD